MHLEEQPQNTEQENQACIKCKSIYSKKEILKYTIWNESGYGYSTRLFQCPVCGQIKILEYYEDSSLDLNIDTKYYNYN